MGKKFLGLGGTDHFWDRAKAWILNQITSAVTAKIAEVVANAPEDLDTLKEIADWISAHADDAAAMNTQITENKNNIAALQTSVAGKADKAHTHSAGDIISGTLPIANGGTGVTTQADINKAFIGNLDVGSSDVTDGTEFVSSYASDNGFSSTDEGSLHTPYKRQFVKVWNYIKGKISSVLGLTKDNYGGKASTSGTADKAITDANGNNIVNTYATKTDIEKTTTKTLNLNTVSSYTTKYIKLGTFYWYDNTSLRCGLYGNNFHDDVNINILNGNTNSASVWGYYSTNSRRTQAIFVKRGDYWNSNIEIYLQFAQETNLSVNVTIDKDYQDRINISESTTAPSGTLEEIAFNNINGMFSSDIDALCIKANNKMIIPIGAPSSLEDGCIWIER